MTNAKPTPVRQRYGPHTSCGECDIRDGRLANACNWRPSAAQQRFLTAYAERPCIAFAARLAAVARCTVYRWLASIPEFEKAVRDAYEVFAAASRKEWEEWADERERWRQERERARRPMRCAILAKAREALKVALKLRGGRKHRRWY